MTIEWHDELTRLGVRASTALVFAPLFNEHVQSELFSAGQVDVEDFAGQILEESGRLERLEEDLNYTPQRLCVVWPHRFQSPGFALPYSHHPEALANYVYGDRLGNKEPGDGWKYRGRGLIQVTGADNYRLIQQITGIPIFDQPDILATSETALLVSIAWWEKKIPDSALGDIKRVTRLVNGGQEGLAQRTAFTNDLKEDLS